MSNNTKKLTLVGLILMIFTTVFGFANSPSAFFLMGYSAIPWYLLSALFFFIPYAFMMAEFGSAFKHEQGGIYSWMAQSIGPKYAFITTFMWFTSYIILMVSIASRVWIPLATFIFGSDTTQSWSLFGLHATQTIGVLALSWTIVVTFLVSKGLKQVKKITAIGGLAVMGLNGVLLLASLFIFFLNNGELAQPIANLHAFTTSPNPSYGTTLATLSFIVFALFAYGGLEAMGSLVDQTENPEKVFPKGVIIAALIISLGYSLGILLWGFSANWMNLLNSETVNLGNITYILMSNLGYELGMAFHLSEATALSLGALFARITGLAMFLALTGAFFTVVYSPIKTLIQGTPKDLWPQKVTVMNKYDIPAHALWIQCLVVVFIIALASFGGSNASAFFNKITLMANVSLTIPYLLLGLAFPAFKKKTNIQRPFVIFKTKASTLLATCSVVATVGFANFFTIIQPAIEGNISNTLWMIAGPIAFSVIAFVIYEIYEKKQHTSSKKKKIS